MISGKKEIYGKNFDYNEVKEVKKLLLEFEERKAEKERDERRRL